MSRAASGDPSSPPMMMPASAQAVATGAAEARPACSKAGAKASAVPGPPAKETDPATAPSSGDSPRATAMAMPMMFWVTRMTQQKRKNVTTAGPPRRRCCHEAIQPMERKKAIISGDWRARSNFNSIPARCCQTAKTAQRARPPMTGSGRQRRPSKGMARASPRPTKRPRAARASVWTRSKDMECYPPPRGSLSVTAIRSRLKWLPEPA